MQVTQTGSKVEQSNRMAYQTSDIKLLDMQTYDGSGQAVHPSVVHIPDGFSGYKVWMVMTPFPNGDDQKENPSIMCSVDGETWIVPPGLTNPIEPTPAGGAYNRDAEMVFDPDNSKLRVYWGNSLGEAYFKESSNGVTWTAKVALTSTSSSKPFASSQTSVVRLAANEWVAFAQNVAKTTDIPYTLTKFISTDGIAWSLDTEVKTNLFSPVWHVGVTVTADGFHFLASTYTKGVLKDKDLFYGYSPDGNTVAFDSTPLISRQKGWLEVMAYKSHLVPFNGKYRVYISGADASPTNKWRIGMVDIQTNNPFSHYAQVFRNLPRQTVLFRDFVIRDATRYYFDNLGTGTGTARSIPDFGLYPNKTLIIRSTLDQPVKLQFRGDMRGAGLWDTINLGAAAQEYTIPNGSTVMTAVDKSIVALLGMIVGNSVALSIQATGPAPTTGEVTIKLMSSY